MESERVAKLEKGERNSVKKQGWIISVASVLGLLVYTYLSYSQSGSAPEFTDHFDDYLFSMFIGAITGIIYFQASQQLNLWFHWKQKLAFRFFVGFSVQASIITGFILLVSWILKSIMSDEGTALFSQTFGDIHIKLVIITVFLIFLSVIVEFAFFSFNFYTATQIEEEQQKRRLLHLQFEALKSQLSPHYLFNSLNTVSSLLYRDADIAEKFIRDLSDSFQYILQKHEQNLVSLEEEITVLKSYSNLMEVRFENSFHLHIDIDKEYLDFKIPPLSLQMLLENALKHNTMSAEDPLDVSVSIIADSYLEVSNPFRAKSGHIVLEDKMLRKPQSDQSMKIGLENIKKRYAFYTEKKVLMHCKKDFIVQLPLIPANYEA